MKEELHLFIIWENARNKEKEIVEDINENFKILKIFDVEWSKDEFSNNLSRFYGTNLPKDSAKEIHCGNGKFLLIIVKDDNPIYENRQTSKGEKIVNINMFDKKNYYRKLTGGGHKIHGTDNQMETNHDITLLLGKNVKDFLEEDTREIWDGKIEEISTDLVGAQMWKTTSEMFYALNNCVNYAILRNYESLPEEIYENDHNDIDIICESLQDIAYVLNAVPVFKEEYRVHYKTQVDNRIAYFDLRHIGDKYYYEQMEKDILKERIYNEKGFYTLNPENYFYSLIYHALIQKPSFKADYKEKLMNMKIEDTSMNTSNEEYAKILKKWFIKKEYIIEEPVDKSVFFNIENVEYFKPLVYKEKIVEVIKNEEKLKELEQKNVELIKRIEAIEDSRTWKIMKPIRNLKKLLKK